MSSKTKQEVRPESPLRPTGSASIPAHQHKPVGYPDLTQKIGQILLEEQPTERDPLVDVLAGPGDGDEQDRDQPHLAGFGLKPHQTEAFKLSPDPQFIDKVRDIVGLYLNPPDAAVVVCVDEKSQIRPLDRSAPILPLLPGLPERRTHDNVRNGTTNLHAALDVASGQVIAGTSPRHRAEEFRRFLKLIDSSVPRHLDVHVVLDTHRPTRPPRSSAGYSATRASRCTSSPPTAPGSTLVERWFAELTTKWIKRGARRAARRRTGGRGRRRPWRVRGHGGDGPPRATAAAPAAPRGGQQAHPLRPLGSSGQPVARRAFTARHLGVRRAATHTLEQAPPEAPRRALARRQLRELWGNIAVTQAYLTLSEVLVHLDLLTNDGRVREVEDDGVARFERV